MNKSNLHRGRQWITLPPSLDWNRAAHPSGRPSPEEIASAAHQIYLSEGSPQGQDRRHWHEAEAQLTADLLA